MPKTVVEAMVVEHRYITEDVKELVLCAPAIAAEAAPGQFVHLKLAAAELLLRRPISIADANVDRGTIRLIYRIIGKGTTVLSALTAGDMVNCLGPLGNGFDLTCERPLLVGGGMGVAPLIFLARQLAPRRVEALVGGRNQTEMFWPILFENLTDAVHVTTDDGSIGMKGFTIDLLPELLEKKQYDRIFVCGPQMMMDAVAKFAAARDIPCQVSLEKYMACGIGACLSCTCEGTDGKRRKVCTDGPVFWAEEVL